MEAVPKGPFGSFIPLILSAMNAPLTRIQSQLKRGVYVCNATYVINMITKSNYIELITQTLTLPKTFINLWMIWGLRLISKGDDCALRYRGRWRDHPYANTGYQEGWMGTGPWSRDPITEEAPGPEALWSNGDRAPDLETLWSDRDRAPDPETLWSDGDRALIQRPYGQTGTGPLV